MDKVSKPNQDKVSRNQDKVRRLVPTSSIIYNNAKTMFDLNKWQITVEEAKNQAIESITSHI